MSEIDVEEIVAGLRQQVAERRLAGDYPVGLEQQLESEFQGMMRAIDRNEIGTETLGALVQSVIAAAHEMRIDAATDSRVPGGSTAHHAAGRVVNRHITPLAESVRDLGVSVADALGEVRWLVQAQSAADERQLLDVLSGVMDRLAVIDHLVEPTTDLERRVTQLESDRHHQQPCDRLDDIPSHVATPARRSMSHAGFPSVPGRRTSSSRSSTVPCCAGLDWRLDPTGNFCALYDTSSFTPRLPFGTSSSTEHSADAAATPI